MTTKMLCRSVLGILISCHLSQSINATIEIAAGKINRLSTNNVQSRYLQATLDDDEKATNETDFYDDDDENLIKEITLDSIDSAPSASPSPSGTWWGSSSPSPYTSTVSPTLHPIMTSSPTVADTNKPTPSPSAAVTITPTSSPESNDDAINIINESETLYKATTPPSTCTATKTSMSCGNKKTDDDDDDDVGDDFIISSRNSIPLPFVVSFSYSVEYVTKNNNKEEEVEYQMCMVHAIETQILNRLAEDMLPCRNRNVRRLVEFKKWDLKAVSLESTPEDYISDAYCATTSGNTNKNKSTSSSTCLVIDAAITIFVQDYSKIDMLKYVARSSIMSYMNDELFLEDVMRPLGLENTNPNKAIKLLYRGPAFSLPSTSTSTGTQKPTFDKSREKNSNQSNRNNNGSSQSEGPSRVQIVVPLVIFIIGIIFAVIASFTQRYRRKRALIRWTHGQVEWQDHVSNNVSDNVSVISSEQEGDEVNNSISTSSVNTASSMGITATLMDIRNLVAASLHNKTSALSVIPEGSCEDSRCSNARRKEDSISELDYGSELRNREPSDIC